MKKRSPFFIKGNFQLKFLLCFVVILAAGIFSSSILIYHSLKDIIEQAAFSSHLSFESSGQIFWRIILQINLLWAGIIILAGLIALGSVYVYLESFFHSLAKGLHKWAQGDFSVRLKLKSKWWVHPLVKDFNVAAEALENKDKEIKLLISTLISAVDSSKEGDFKEIKSIHQKLRQTKFS